MFPSEFNGHQIRNRESDGYVSATDICNACDVNWDEYVNQKEIIEFIEELSKSDFECNPPLTNGSPVQCITDGPVDQHGVWVHYHIAMNFGQWASPKFAVKLVTIIHKYLSGNITLVSDVVEQSNNVTGKINNVEIKSNPVTGEILCHVEHYNDNHKKTTWTHSSGHTV
jgi:hypothetical protein